MTALLDRVSLRGEAARDVLAVWLTITAALTYLDVPLRHSPLFAANIVLQASLGMLVITRLLRSVAPSLLLLCGPGLILGGALSFAVFQIAGRGQVGLIVTTLFGATAVIALLISHRPYQSLESRWWMLGQLLGLAALAMSSEFPEMLPVAIVFFALSFSDLQIRLSRGLLSLTLLMLAGFVVYISLRSRQDYWWAITDDYLLLETLKNHLVAESPFAPWGVTSFARYHWLSYGWSAVLDYASGAPSPFLTLTQVMPIVYSIALGASVIMVATVTRHLNSFREWILPVWAVIAVARLDWSGTSTAGTYAVLASVLFVAIQLSDAKRFLRAAIVLTLFLSILVLTKFPSIFSAILITALVLLQRAERSTFLVKQRLTLGILARVLLIPTLMLAVYISSKVVEGRFRFVSVNRQLGQLATAGAPFAGLTLAVNQLWLWVAITALSWNLFLRRPSQSQHFTTGPSLYLLAAISGVIFDVFITSTGDNHKYFSVPMYFVASTALLSPAMHLQSLSKKSAESRLQYMVMIFMIIVGAVWSDGGLFQVFWDAVSRAFPVLPTLGVELLKFFTNEGRFFAAAIGALLLPVVVVQRRHVRTVMRPLILSIIVLSLFAYLRPALGSYETAIPDTELEAYIGADYERRLGERLKAEVPVTDLIATNHVSDESGGGVERYAISAWSRREFLVLGPKVSGEPQARLDAIKLSRTFADNPTRESCGQLRAARVHWFLVDRSLTAQTDWSICGVEVFQADKFLLLRLND